MKWFTRIGFISLSSIALTFVLSSQSLAAGSANANLTVQATVTDNCSITTTNLNFGDYNPLATSPTDGEGGVTITCTKNSNPLVALSLGNNPNGTTRQMSDGTDNLSYNIYQPSSATPNAACAFTTAWNETDKFDPGKTPSSSPRSYKVCGRIPQGQDVGGGTYNDLVVATVSY